METNKITYIAIFISITLIIGVFLFTKDKSSLENKVEESNVSIIDGKQIITINAKGGYFPQNTKARSDLPTALNIVTKSTFDCSSALVIPSLNYRSNLPLKGTTEIGVPFHSQKAGTKLEGLCSMGMYNFSIDFE